VRSVQGMFFAFGMCPDGIFLGSGSVPLNL
jgi:hypothetical protein